MLCGGERPVRYGFEGHKNCYNYSIKKGWFKTRHILKENRYGHVSWSVEPEGTILMGGIVGDGRQPLNSSEIVKHDGTTERTFDLKYRLQYE